MGPAGGAARLLAGHHLHQGLFLRWVADHLRARRKDGDGAVRARRLPSADLRVVVLGRLIEHRSLDVAARKLLKLLPCTRHRAPRHSCVEGGSLELSAVVDEHVDLDRVLWDLERLESVDVLFFQKS